jgi:hypothetical protein
MGNCKRIRNYLAEPIFLRGTKSAIKKEGYEEVGLVPPYGLQFEVLAKCSDKSYHFD